MKHSFLHTIKKFSFVSILALGINACGGADVPYIVPPSGTTPPVGVITPIPPTGGSRCAIKLTETKLNVKGLAGPNSPGHDAGQPDGQFSSPEGSLPDIPIRFYGNEVKMIPADFPLDAVFSLSGNNINIKLADGTTPTGTFNGDDKSIVINGVQFEINNALIGRNILPPFQLTTGSATVEGRFGSDSDTGSAINAETRAIKLVGGFRIPNNFGEGSTVDTIISPLRDGVMMISLSGILERMPDGAPCTDGGAGVVATEVVGEGTDAREIPLGDNNTLGMGNIFQPEQDVDTPSDADPRFTAIKKLRVRNATTGAITGNIDNRQGYIVTPAGAFTIAPNEAKDFTVKFNVPFMQGEIPASRDVQTQYAFGSLNVTMVASVKKPGPLLVLSGTDENARSSVSFGNVLAKVLGTASNARLRCDAQTTPTVTSRKITIENKGTRPLEITSLPRPRDAVAQTGDPGCVAGYGSEFIRNALKLEGGATCVQSTDAASGRSYNTDRCTLPPNSTSKLSFKVIYYPYNASSIVNAQNGVLQNDAATMEIGNSDPAYNASQHKLTLNLSGAVSADQSAALSISRAQGVGAEVTQDSEKVIANGGLSRINIPSAEAPSVAQAFFLRNNSSEVLNIREIRVEGDNAESFQVLSSPAVPTTVNPVSPTGEPGKARFAVSFTKGDRMRASASLRVTFRVGSSGTDSVFRMTLNGSVNRQTPRGMMQLVVKSYNVLVDNNLAGAVNSDDSRNGLNANIKPGPINFTFEPIVDGDIASPLRKVVLQPALADRGMHPSNPNILEDLRRLRKIDREKLFRFYSTRFTRSGNNPDIYDEHRNLVCNEPDSIEGAHEVNNCGYFYYILANKPNQYGIYDDDTGQMLLPDLDLKLVIPYHADVGEYRSNLFSVIEMETSITTQTLDSPVITGFPGSTGPLPLVMNGIDFVMPSNFPPQGGSGQLGATPDTQCPENWSPKNFETVEQLPKIGCFITPAPRQLLKGFSFEEKEDGSYVGTIVLLIKFAGADATYGSPPRPQNIPFFLRESRMWVAITGTLQPANTGATP